MQFDFMVDFNLKRDYLDVLVISASPSSCLVSKINCSPLVRHLRHDSSVEVWNDCL